MENSRGFVLGMLLGAVVMWFWRALGPIFAPVARPLLKQTMKATMVGAVRVRERAAELGETVEDIWAEAQQELEDDSTQPATPA